MNTDETHSRGILALSFLLIRVHLSISSLDWKKKNLAQSRKDAKKTNDAAGYGILPV
jgi:hypothetical protein